MFDRRKANRRSRLAAIGILLAGVAGVTADVPRKSIGEDGTALTSTGREVRQTVECVPRAPFFCQPPSPSAASAAVLNVAIVASASGDVTDPFFTVPQSLINASGFFATVTVIHAGQTTPTLADLQAFDAVLVWSNFDFADPATLGDNLADYVNAGGGVVVSLFANSSSSTGRFIGGRWSTLLYDVVPAQSGTAVGAASLGTITDPAHAIMAGVTSFNGGMNGFRPQAQAGLTAIIAQWDDGKTLVAAREDTVGARVDLGFYPVSDAVLPGSWDATTDGGLLLSNALLYASQRPPLQPGDSNADGVVDDVDTTNFINCFTGDAAGPVPANCVTFDFDADTDVDCNDWLAFLAVWAGVGTPPTFAQCGVPCVDNVICDDADICTTDLCLAGFCSNTVFYGDVDHNLTVNLFDLFCVLDGFSGIFTTCSFADNDIEPCGGNGTLNLFDLFAVLDVFSGIDPCCGG